MSGLEQTTYPSEPDRVNIEIYDEVRNARDICRVVRTLGATCVAVPHDATARVCGAAPRGPFKIMPLLYM